MRSEVIMYIIVRRKGKFFFIYLELRLVNVFISIFKEIGLDVFRFILLDND